MIIINSKLAYNANVPSREEMFEGELYLVAPVIALVEGVHNGTAGPLMYNANEISKFAEAWNGSPLPISHPKKDGELVSANSPRVLESNNVGRAFNMHFEDNKLKGEIWVNIKKAQALSPQVLSTIRNQEPLEISTSFYSDDDGIPGEWHGEKYNASIINIRPDHIALLPTEIGACSWEDGCGVRANIAKEKNPSLLKRFGNFFNQLFSDVSDLSDNEASHGDIRTKLQPIVDSWDNALLLHYIVDMYDDYFIYCAESRSESPPPFISKLYKRNYTLNENEEIVLSNEAVEVRKEKMYIPVANSKENPMAKKNEMIDGLIARPENQFTDADKDWMDKLDEDALSRFVAPDPPAINNEEPPSTNNEEPPANNEEPPVAPTLDDVIANASGEVQETLQRAVARERQIKSDMVDALLDNARCNFTKEELGKKNIEELGNLATLAQIDNDFSGAVGGSVANESDAIPEMPKVFENI